MAAEKKSKIKKTKEPVVYFADMAVESLEPDKTLPAKFKRTLKLLDLPSKVKDKRVVIKMHFGGSFGYTTIHPVFVRILVEALKTSGCKSVCAIDGDASNALARGYTHEVLGCPVISCFGEGGKYYYREDINFKKLDFAYYSGEAVDADFFIDLSHVKGHGDCGFGGAIKNIAMGIVPGEIRFKLHSLEGGIKYYKNKCTFCLKCKKACPNNAINADKENKEISFFFHNCTYCQHCVMICPEGALKMEDRKFEDFSMGMALVTAKFLQKFKPENLLFINLLTNITIYCDCWGMTTPSLVPDIGLLVSDDIAAVETASLDLIKTENFLPNGLPKNRKLLDVEGHLFKKIHAKDPYVMINFLEKVYNCSSKYKMIEVK